MLNEAIEDHKTGDYVVTRTTGATWVMGRKVAGTESTFSISASVQPAPGEELVDAPEGASLEDIRVIYTATRLIARRNGTPGASDEDDTDRVDPDVIAIDGEAFEVYKVAKWDHWGETHYVAYAAKIDP